MNIYSLSSLLLLCGVLAQSARAEEVLVSAAASLKETLAELAPLCQKQTGLTLVPNLAASGILARQIEAGAPADIFISADDATMDDLQKAGLLQPGTRTPLLGNVLVFVVPTDSTLKIDGPGALEQPAIKHIGVGDPKTVPAGHYAQLYLEKTKVWSTVQDKLVPLDNVRSVLAAVASTNVDAGIVYRTDVAIEPRVRVAWTVPAADGPVIDYPVAVLKNAHSLTAAAQVRAFLLSEAARAVFSRHGFTLPPAAATTP
jgi:molybdate transport system substrate-binding protein